MSPRTLNKPAKIAPVSLSLPDQAAAGSSAEAAYARLEALCSAVRAELATDLRISDAAVLPSFVSLPQVTAAEYGRVRRRLPRCCVAAFLFLSAVVAHAAIACAHLSLSSTVRHRSASSDHQTAAVKGLEDWQERLTSLLHTGPVALWVSGSAGGFPCRAWLTALGAQLFVGDLMDTLAQHPPPQPSRRRS